MIQKWSLIIFMVLSTSISGCGGSGSSSNSFADADSHTPAADTQTGVFLDSAVAGIGYRTETLEGTTNDAGEYDFLPGESVVFFIGDLVFPPVEAKGVVTPLDMAASGSLDDQIVINIARLLQSLDADGDPSNGITISEVAWNSATVIDFDVPTDVFAANPDVISLVANSGSSNDTLVSAEIARSHLQNTIDAVSLIGSWYYRDIQSSDPANQYHIVLTFLDDNTFVIANDEAADDAGTDGFEIGSYSWNVTSRVFEPTVRIDTNGEWGFSHSCNDSEILTIELRDGRLLLGTDGGVGESCEEVDGGAIIAFERVASTDEPLVGSWLSDIALEDNDKFALVTFMDSSNYMMMQSIVSDNNGHPGIERGTYLHNNITNEVIFSTITDTNGQWGFSHPCAVLDIQEINNLACGPGGQDILQTLEVNGDNLIFISEADTIVNSGEADPVEFMRIQ